MRDMYTSDRADSQEYSDLYDSAEAIMEKLLSPDGLKGIEPEE